MLWLGGGHVGEMCLSQSISARSAQDPGTWSTWSRKKEKNTAEMGGRHAATKPQFFPLPHHFVCVEKSTLDLTFTFSKKTPKEAQGGTKCFFGHL